MVDEKKLKPMIEAIPSLLPIGACADLKRFAERIKDRQLACVKEYEVDIQPPARIGAAIKEFRKRPIGRTVENLTWEGKDEALRWVLCQISDKDFGLEEEKK
ncbi:MAG: hypothetical protein IMF11_20195 [Proteobacteria bacterium]|nr:hypothetical protein [Pseudomonadota bacterium]